MQNGLNSPMTVLPAKKTPKKNPLCKIQEQIPTEIKTKR